MSCNLSKCICVVFVIIYILAQLSDLLCQDNSTDEICITIIVILLLFVIIITILAIIRLFIICIRRCRNRQQHNRAYQVPLLVDDINYQPNNPINQSQQYYQPSVDSSENPALYRETYNQNQCTVCLEEFVEGEKLGRLPCGHKFHSVCIGDWADRHRSCPICRINI